MTHITIDKYVYYYWRKLNKIAPSIMNNSINLNQTAIRTFLSALIAVFLILMAGCSLKIPSEEPSWTVNFDFPLTKDNVSMKEILDDSLLTTIPLDGNGEPVLYAFQDTIEIEEQTFDDTVGVDPTEKLVSSELDTIELENIDPKKTDAYLLSEIYPTVSSMSGSNVIPAFTLSPVAKNFTFEDFKSADFAGGSMSMTIQNDMVIPLGPPVNVDIQDMNGNTLVASAAKWEEEIASNTSSSKTLNMAGISLVGEIKIVVTGSSPGSGGTAITVDDAARSSSFTVEISASEPKVTSAVAQVPEQTIDEMGVIQIDSENKVERAKIDRGTLAIEIKNGLDLEADLKLTISSIQDDNGTVFTQLIQMPRKDDVISSYDLNSKWMVLDVTMDPQKVNYSYEVVTEDSKNDADPFRNVNSIDVVDVEIDLYGSGEGEQITFSEIKGIIAAIEEPIETIRQEISALPDEFDGMEFMEAEMNLVFDSNIEFPVKLDMDIIAFNNDTSATRQIRGWNVTHPDSQTIVIPDAVGLINIKPDSILASGTAVIGGSNDVVTYEGNESFSGIFSISIPFVFQLADDAMIDLDAEKIDQEFPENIESVTVFMEYDNMFDFDTNISLLSAANESHFETGSPTTPNVLGSLSIKGNSSSIDSLHLDESQIELFDDIIFVKTKVFLSSNGEVKFLSTDSLKITSYGSVKYLVDPTSDEN